MSKKEYSIEELCSTKELAQSIGVTPQRVTYYVQNGHIPKEYYTTKGERKFFITKYKEDIKRTIAQNQNVVAVARERRKKEAKRLKKKTEAELQTKKEEDYRDLTGLDAEVIDPEDFNKYKTLEVKFKAAQAKHNFEALKKENVPSKEVAIAWTTLVLAAKSKILSIKGEVASMIKEFVVDKGNQKLVLDAIDRIIRDTLTDLSK